MKKQSFFKKSKDKSSAKKRLWIVFSLFIRQSYADWQGNVACFTCGIVKHWKEMDAGHYHPRTDGLSLYFEEKNVHPQCTACNRFRHGNLTMYAIALRRKYGESILEELEWKRRQKITITEDEYNEFIMVYKNKIKELLKTGRI